MHTKNSLMEWQKQRRAIWSVTNHCVEQIDVISPQTWTGLLQVLLNKSNSIKNKWNSPKNTWNSPKNRKIKKKLLTFQRKHTKFQINTWHVKNTHEIPELNTLHSANFDFSLVNLDEKYEMSLKNAYPTTGPRCPRVVDSHEKQ